VGIPAASATVRIQSDPGGEVRAYFIQYATLRESGEDVIIDGPCLSACTLVLSVIPRDRICVTERAVLGFHAAWSPDGNGGRVTNVPATRMMLATYPAKVRSWIKRRGGLSPRMIMLSGRELNAMYAPCSRTAGGTTPRPASAASFSATSASVLSSR
jgi:hypothetical protein